MTFVLVTDVSSHPGSRFELPGLQNLTKGSMYVG